MKLSKELRTVARGFRWGRPPALPSFTKAPKVKTEATFETDWARDGWAIRARGVVQEAVMLPGLRMLARPTVRGRERLEGVPQPAIVVANHASHLDTALLIDAVPLHWRDRLAVGAAADYFFADRIRGTVAALCIGAFPVERTRGSAVSVRLAQRLIDEGYNLILFPEGGRSDDGWLQELQPGAAWLAARKRCPVVPIWIKGTEHILRKGDNRVRPGRTELTIGDVLWPRDGEDRTELNARIEAALRRLAHEASDDWWTSLRSAADEDAAGPPAGKWRRIWARGEAPRAPRSTWR